MTRTRSEKVPLLSANSPTGRVGGQLIDAESAEKIGAGRYERSIDRTTHRNGARLKGLSTKAGDLQLDSPKLRKGSCFPSILEPRRRIDQALYAVVMEAYVNGVSTRMGCRPPLHVRRINGRPQRVVQYRPITGPARGLTHRASHSEPHHFTGLCDGDQNGA